jgi:hypothetical protein
MLAMPFHEKWTFYVTYAEKKKSMLKLGFS